MTFPAIRWGRVTGEGSVIIPSKYGLQQKLQGGKYASVIIDNQDVSVFFCHKLFLFSAGKVNDLSVLYALFYIFAY